MLTDNIKQNAEITGSSYFIWDHDLPGFGLRVSRRGTVSWVIQRRLKGRSRRISLGSDMTASMARRTATKLLEQMAQGIDPSPETRRAGAKKGAITLALAIDTYLEEKNLKDSSREDIRSAMRSLSDWMSREVDEIKASEVAERHALLTQRARKNGARANLVMRYLRTILNYANVRFTTDINKPLIAINPVKMFSAMGRWNREFRRRTYLDSVGLPSAWHAVDYGIGDMHYAESYRLAFVLCLFTGCRPTEALLLRWSDIDWSRDTLTFQDTKNHSDHVLPLGPVMSHLLRCRLNQLDNPGDQQQVIALPDGSVPATFSTMTKRISLLTGSDFIMTDLRRTYVTAAATLEISPYTLKRLLNHAMDRDVTGGYLVIEPEHLRKPQARIQQYLLSQAQGVETNGNVRELAP